MPEVRGQKSEVELRTSDDLPHSCFFHKRLCFHDEADMFGLADFSTFVIGEAVEGDFLSFDDCDGGFGADGAADEGWLLVGKADEAADGGFAFGETFLHRIAGGFFHESRKDGGGEDGEPLFTTFAVSFSVTILVAVPFIPVVMDMGILLFIIDID